VGVVQRDGADLLSCSISSTLGFPQLPRLEELSMAHNWLVAVAG